MIRTFAFVPGATATKSSSGTSATSRIVFRSTTVTIGIPGFTNAPGSFERSATSPSNGDRMTQSFTLSVVSRRCASSARYWLCLLSLSADFCSISFGEAKPPSFSCAMRSASCEIASCWACTARACAATALFRAEALRQSSVAST
jgi:hypothetical protein